MQIVAVLLYLQNFSFYVQVVHTGHLVTLKVIASFSASRFALPCCCYRPTPPCLFGGVFPYFPMTWHPVPASDCLISYTNAYQYISQYVRDLWQSKWDTAVNNKLQATKPLIGEQLSTYRSVRREEVVLLKLGHNYLTHSYLFKGEPPPECVTCN